jgi:hypothetical protein
MMAPRKPAELAMGEEFLTREDVEQLRLLSIFHYVVAGGQALIASVPILHFLLGAWLLFGAEWAERANDRVPTALMGGFFMAFSGAFILIGWSLAICLAIAGRSLAQRTRHTFCTVIDVIAALWCMPFGTVLGILTIIVLQRPSVKRAFGVATDSAPRPTP